MCIVYVRPEISAGGHDLPDEGQPNFTPPSPLQINVNLEVPSDSHDSPDGGKPNFIPPKYSEEYCPDSYYDPKAGRSHAMPKLKKKYSITPASKQILLPAIFTPPENFTQRKRISTTAVKESEL